MDPMKILLVDDSKSARYALRLQLQRHGVEVETADSAESAFDILEKLVPDAILLDHMMPGLNGFEALEVIRDNPRTAQIPVVMCTSHEDPEFAATAERKGVVGILPKSVAPEKLPEVLAKLRKIIGSRGPQPPRAAEAPATANVPVTPAASVTASVLPVTPAAPALSEQDVERMIEARIESRVTSLLSRTLEDLRHDLIENLSEDTRRLLDARLAQERASQASAHAEDVDSRFRAAVKRLAEEDLPQLVRVEIEAERGQSRKLVERSIIELESRMPNRAREIQDRLAAIENKVVGEAQAAAQRESRRVVTAATEQARQVAESARQSLGSGLTRVYLAILASTAIGVGAAVVVYALLR